MWYVYGCILCVIVCVCVCARARTRVRVCVYMNMYIYTDSIYYYTCVYVCGCVVCVIFSAQIRPYTNNEAYEEEDTCMSYEEEDTSIRPYTSEVDPQDYLGGVAVFEIGLSLSR